MLTLTLCLLCLLAAVGGVSSLLVRHFSRLVVTSQAEMAKTLVAGLTTLVAPVLSPGLREQVPQSEIPTAFEDPTWATDWDGSVPGDSTPSVNP